MLPHLYGRLRRPLPRSAIARLPSGASPAEIAASKMRCARLAAPFVTALCIFDTLRGGSAARRSYIMVSSRAYSSPVPQPASRHSIKPFSIQPIIANIRHSAVSTSQYRFAIWGRRCGECPFAFFAAKPHDLNPALLRMFAMMAIAIGRVSNWKAMASHIRAHPARHVR